MKVMMSALFAALITVARFITIQLAFTPVPIAFQDMMAILCGVLLGPLYGALAVLLFLVMGCLGLPVLSSGVSGLQAIIASPTVGFILGYLIAAFCAGVMTQLLLRFTKPIVAYITATTIASIALFACGVMGFMIVTSSNILVTLTAVVVPFIPGNIVKIVIITVLAMRYKNVITNYVTVIKD